MTKIARIIIPGLPHHVTQRGNRRQQTFFGADDYRAYLNFLRAQAASFNFEIWSYCLMPNHIHLLVVPETSEALREGIGQTHHAYTRLINKKREWKGHLWQGRFFSAPVDMEKAAIVARYIELNPVRAGICKHPCDYPWSSASEACNSRLDGSNGFSPLWSPGGSWEEFLCSEMVDSGMEEQIRICSRSGRPVGSEDFVVRLEQQTGLTLRHKKRGPKKRNSSLPEHLP